MGELHHEPFQVAFNGFLKVAFQGSRITSDAGLILVRELDERLGLATLISEHLSDSRQGLNTQFSLADLLRQSVYSRLAGYEDLNDAVRVSADPTFRLIGSPKRWDRGGALTSTLHWFEPGFPFCQPDQGLHTPTRLSARQISSAHVIPLPTPVRWGRARRETDWSPCFQGISQAPLHTCALSSPLRCTQAARQPPGTGSAQILRSMSPNSRRVRCPSASRSQ